MGGETIDGDNTFGRGDSRECLNQPPRGIGHDRAPLGMQIGTRAKGAKLEKRDAFEAETHDRSLFCVAPAFVPQTAVSFQKFGMFTGKAIKTRTAETVFSLNKKTQRDRQFTECLLIRFNRRETRDEIAFAVCSTARVQLSVLDRRREWTGTPFSQMTHRLHVVMTVKDEALWTTSALTVNNRIA